MAAIIVYGPQGTGKTLHAKALAKHYGKNQIIEDDFGSHGVTPYPDDALVLINDRTLADMHSDEYGAQVVSIADALREARISH